MFLLSKTQQRPYGKRLPPEEETTGKRGKSLALTVGASESIGKDGVVDALVVGQTIAQEEPALQ